MSVGFRPRPASRGLCRAAAERSHAVYCSEGLGAANLNVGFHGISRLSDDSIRAEEQMYAIDVHTPMA